ncbi:MAG: tetraacyldisaccharide 4'-kinase [Rhodobacteraceae bacterium]|nr:MAG: tetraacyldisaccharide 4'-kinase [Paracoccaceae bacterium]
MHPPGFWDRPAGPLAAALTPLSWLWRAGGALRRARARPFRGPVPVICVGNLTLGGAGKTPTAIALLAALAERGAPAAAVSRGHGGTERGPHRVDPATDAAARVGDEPLLLAAFAPTFVARDRAAGVAAAAAAGARVVVLDDGHQNPSVVKDLSLVVVDAGAGFGNGRVFPAGPLREPIAEGLARADSVVLIGDDAEAAATLARWPSLSDKPVLRARLTPLATGLPLEGAPVVAFAGIGRPEKFFATLRALGADLRATRSFPDHATYAPALLRRLAAEARAADAMLVTTEKDAVRLPPAFRREVMALPVRLAFDDPAALAALLSPVCAAATTPPPPA